MNSLNIQQNKGVALIITVLLMTLILFLSLYFLDFSLTEKRIAVSQVGGTKTYYLAEAGIAEMVYKLKNDLTFKNNFETNPNWTTSTTRNNPFGPNSGSYTVTIANSSLAHGEIIATSTVNIGAGESSQRVVKTYVYRAMGTSTTEVADHAGYADGNIDISASRVNFYNGAAHSNNVFTINLVSTVNVETDLKAVGNYIESAMSTVNVGGSIYAANKQPAADPIEMPAVDFGSADSNSWKNRADVIYTSNDFDNLMADNQTLTLNDPITYVEGDVDIYGDQDLIINGVLIVERDLEIGKKECRGSRCGRSNITINHATGTPAGILAKRKIKFSFWSGDIDSEGVIYATDQLDILSIPFGFNFNAEGGLISRKLTITSVWSDVDITCNNDILNDTIGTSTEFSPIITVEHWEEEY